MISVLIRPHFLSLKNHVLGRGNGSRSIGRDLFLIVLSAILMIAIYIGLSGFLYYVNLQGTTGITIVARGVSFVTLLVFFLLIFSNTASALGFLFAAQNTYLLLSLPITLRQLYNMRICEILISSSWMFLLIAVPGTLAIMQSLDLSPSFLVLVFLICLPLLLIPAIASTIFVTLLVNIFSPHRLRDLSIVIALIAIGCFIVFAQRFPAFLSTELTDPNKLAHSLLNWHMSDNWILPSTWVDNVFTSFVNSEHIAVMSNLAAILAITTVLYALGYFCFSKLFYRGWTRTNYTRKNATRSVSKANKEITLLVTPLPSQFRAIFLKEIRVFLRDATQTMQLIFLLLLTLLYLYNFRALRLVAAFNEEVQEWWMAVLCICNVALGGCVIAAICTRFVFPAVSLEGKSFSLLRTSPLPVKSILMYKFLSWVIPAAFLSALFIVSGAWAIQVPEKTVYLCALIGIALAIGVVGLGIGLGAIYARFDWDSPTEIASSVGSMAYMFLSMALIFFTLIPAAFVIVVTSIPRFFVGEHSDSLVYSLAIATSLVFIANAATAYKAIEAGAQSLKDREK